MVPSDAGYVDLTSVNPYNPEKAKALLKEAGVQTPLNVTLTLPPPHYARKGGEIIASQLAKVGVVAKIENVEWAQWLSGAFKGNFDLTVISHVEPLDFDRYGDPSYYYGYDSKAYRDLLDGLQHDHRRQEGRLKLLGDIQRQLATDSVNVYLFQLPQFAVANKRLKGLWSSSPIFANDLGALELAIAHAQSSAAKTASGDDLRDDGPPRPERRRADRPLPRAIALAGRGDARRARPHRRLGAAPARDLRARRRRRARLRRASRRRAGCATSAPARTSARSKACRR